jgi:transcriptional regulator with XRE-family HTH domain
MLPTKLQLILDLYEESCNPVDMITRSRAKVTLKERGWSQRRAAEHLGVTQAHLSQCLNGQRTSMRLMREIADIPISPIPYTKSGFAKKTCRKGGSRNTTSRRKGKR